MADARRILEDMFEGLEGSIQNLSNPRRKKVCKYDLVTMEPATQDSEEVAEYYDIEHAAVLLTRSKESMERKLDGVDYGRQQADFETEIELNIMGEHKNEAIDPEAGKRSKGPSVKEFRESKKAQEQAVAAAAQAKQKKSAALKELEEIEQLSPEDLQKASRKVTSWWEEEYKKLNKDEQAKLEKGLTTSEPIAGVTSAGFFKHESGLLNNDMSQRPIESRAAFEQKAPNRTAVSAAAAGAGAGAAPVTVGQPTLYVTRSGAKVVAKTAGPGPATENMEEDALLAMSRYGVI